LQNRDDEWTQTKKIKRNRGFNITGVILYCQFGCTVGPVMPSWKMRKIWLGMGGGEGKN
jgi:hypothetical protein